MRHCVVFGGEGVGRQIPLGSADRERKIVREPEQPLRMFVELFSGLSQQAADLNNVLRLALKDGRNLGGDLFERTMVHKISPRNIARLKSSTASGLSLRPRRRGIDIGAISANWRPRS